MKFSVLVLGCIASSTNAFTSTPHSFVARSSTTPIRMSDSDEDAGSAGAVSITTQSGDTKKEIGYDEATGRFYETTNECDPVDEYCAIDEETGKLFRLTNAEKERIFLDALQSYYASGRQLLSDDEFDQLKSDLSWAGSDLVNMNRKEAKYLNAMQAYLKGSPVMSDAEFDVLKTELKEDGSKFAVTTEPQCYIDTGICKVTLQEDFFRTNLLYLPVGAILTLLWLGLGYELIGGLIRINPIIFTLVGSPLIAKYATELTNDYIFKDFKIAYGPCPNCEAENRIFFGDILGVEGFGDVADVKCSNCKTEFSVQKDSLRASTLPK